MAPRKKVTDVAKEKIEKLPEAAPDKTEAPEGPRPAIKSVEVNMVSGEVYWFETETGLLSYQLTPNQFEAQEDKGENVVLTVIPITQIEYIEYTFAKPESAATE